MGYYIGIDQGTTNTTAVLVDENWKILAKASRKHRQIYPKPGWVEHDPIEIHDCVLLVIREVLDMVPGASAEDIIALGLDHQGETCVIWDKETGQPIYNAIVWQDRRTADVCLELKEKYGSEIQKICGLVPDSYHSAAKLQWMLDNIDGARERAERGELLAGTLNTWLFWTFTNHESFETDVSSAACTMLLDMHTADWSDRLLELCNIPRDILPKIVDTNHVYGMTDPSKFLGVSVALAGTIADSPSGMIGGGCFGEGYLKISYGTGSFMHFQTGSKIIESKKGLFTRTSFMIDGTPMYTLSGASYVAGGAVTWLKDVHLIESEEDTERMAMQVRDTGDVSFVPAFSGLATPYWDQYARGLFIGLTAGTSREQLVRAVMESLALQVANCFRTMKNESGVDCKVMLADGGMVENKFLMQFQSDILGVTVRVPEEKETCAFGAACLAGFSIGALPSLESVKNLVKVKYTYEPMMSEDERESRIIRWTEAVQRSMNWAK